MKQDIDKEVDEPFENTISDSYQNVSDKFIDRNLDKSDKYKIEEKKLEIESRNKLIDFKKFREVSIFLYIMIALLIFIIAISLFFEYSISNNFNRDLVLIGVETLKALIFAAMGYLFSKKDN